MYQFFKLTLRSNVCGLLGFGCGQTSISYEERGQLQIAEPENCYPHCAHTNCTQGKRRKHGKNCTLNSQNKTTTK